jgi:hypothetical protein
MARDLEGSGVTSNCLEPGWVFTDLAREGDIALQASMQTGGMSPAKGAMTSLYCATDPGLESVTGSYFTNSGIAASTKESNDTGFYRTGCGKPVSTIGACMQAPKSPGLLHKGDNRQFMHLGRLL